MIISTDKGRGTFNKIQHLFLPEKILHKLEMEINFLSMIKGVYEKHSSHIIPIGKICNCSPKM